MTSFILLVWVFKASHVTTTFFMFNLSKTNGIVGISLVLDSITCEYKQAH